MFAASRIVDLALTRLTEWALRRYTDLNVRDYDKLLHISDDFAVAELEPRDGDWVAGRRLDELRLRDEGLIVLGVYRRDGTYLGVPLGSMLVRGRRPSRCLRRGRRHPSLAGRPVGPEGDRCRAEAVQACRVARSQTFGNDAEAAS